MNGAKETEDDCSAYLDDPKFVEQLALLSGTAPIMQTWVAAEDFDEFLADLPQCPVYQQAEQVKVTSEGVQENSNEPVGALLPCDRASAPVAFDRTYAFPVPESRVYERFSNAALIDELVALTGQAGLGEEGTQYGFFRAKFCAIHIEMNLRQQHAPRFRPQSSLPKKAEGIDETLARDRQVIDLHWRANSTDKPMSPVADFPGIFDNERFDFDLAARFAQLTWWQQTKVIHLHLTEDMQWEHAIIQAPSLRDRWRTIERGDVRGSEVKQVGAPHIYTLLHESMSNEPHLRRHIPGLVRIWKARRIVGDAPQRIARLVGLMTGEKPKDASATRRAMASLEARIASGKKRR